LQINVLNIYETDKPRYSESCRKRRKCSSCKSDFCLIGLLTRLCNMVAGFECKPRVYNVYHRVWFVFSVRIQHGCPQPGPTGLQHIGPSSHDQTISLCRGLSLFKSVRVRLEKLPEMSEKILLTHKNKTENCPIFGYANVNLYKFYGTKVICVARKRMKDVSK